MVAGQLLGLYLIFSQLNKGKQQMTKERKLLLKKLLKEYKQTLNQSQK